VVRLITPQVSIDYGVVFDGENELELDSGERRLLKRGDLFVQRGTMHKWKHLSDVPPARLVAVQLDSRDMVIDGKALPATM
jgi:quercetin dioxygenase-like cupin family protein